MRRLFSSWFWFGKKESIGYFVREKNKKKKKKENPVKKNKKRRKVKLEKKKKKKKKKNQIKSSCIPLGHWFSPIVWFDFVGSNVDRGLFTGIVQIQVYFSLLLVILFWPIVGL
jgi:hypothetical protein